MIPWTAYEYLVVLILTSIALLIVCTSTNKFLITVLRWARQIWLDSEPDDNTHD